jgi:rsbT co-antagonist protein RsbR
MAAPPPLEDTRKFFDLYQPWSDEAQETLLAELASDPELGPIIANMSEAERTENNAQSRERLRAGCYEGLWDPYFQNLREQGRGYALIGLSFAGWFKAVDVVRRYFVPRLVDQLADSPDELKAMMRVLDWYVDLSMCEIGEEYLSTKEAVIAQQQAAIGELSTPVLPVADGLLVLPLIGVVDSRRAHDLTQHLLEAIRSWRALVVVIDVTGVPAVDTAVANHLLQTAQAARLMGATVVMSGISAANAQTLVRIGVDLSMLQTVADLRRAIELANAMLAERGVTPGEWDPSGAAS